MRILFISQYAGAPEMGMVLRNYNWATELIRLGHDCKIIAASYSHYRKKNINIKGEKFKEEKIDGITYYWINTGTYNAKNNILRVLAILQFQIGLRKLLANLQNDYEVVVVSSPHPFQIYLGHKFSKKCNAKLIFDIRDLWPLTLQKIGKLSAYHPLIIALKYAEKYALRNSDLVTAVPQNSKKYLVSKGMIPSKFLHIGNSLNLNSFGKSLPLEKMIQKNLVELKNQGSTLVGYCGSLGLANAMHVPINAISKTKDVRINLVIIGNGTKEDELKLLAKDLNIQERVHFFDFLPHNQVASFLSLMDASYAGGLKSTLYEYGASLTKINDYMASEKPIIYAVGDPNSSIEKSGCGIFCKAEDIDQIAIAMDKIAKMNNSELQVMGERGRTWLLKNQTIQRQIQQILNKL